MGAGGAGAAPDLSSVSYAAPWLLPARGAGPGRAHSRGVARRCHVVACRAGAVARAPPRRRTEPCGRKRLRPATAAARRERERLSAQLHRCPGSRIREIEACVHHRGWQRLQVTRVAATCKMCACQPILVQMAQIGVTACAARRQSSATRRTPRRHTFHLCCHVTRRQRRVAAQPAEAIYMHARGCGTTESGPWSTSPHLGALGRSGWGQWHGVQARGAPAMVAHLHCVRTKRDGRSMGGGMSRWGGPRRGAQGAV